MKREILLTQLQEHYSYKMAHACINGTRKPSYDVMCILDRKKKNRIPFHAWKDIKSFISNNNNSSTTSNKTTIKAS